MLTLSKIVYCDHNALRQASLGEGYVMLENYSNFCMWSLPATELYIFIFIVAVKHHVPRIFDAF